MRVKWHTLNSEKIIIKCPICGHQTAPPQCPHCSHTLFVFIDPASDDAFFDFMRPDLADRWKNIRARKPRERILINIDTEGSCEVFDVTESSGYYPTRVVVGF